MGKEGIMTINRNISKMSLSRIISGLVIAIATFFICTGSASTQGTGDYFLYHLDKLPKNVLADTIGFTMFLVEFTEDSILDPKTTRFLSYNRKSDQFIPAKGILAAETLPVGYAGHNGWIKYLVTARQGEYVQIITDPYKNLRTWIKPDKTKREKATIFADLIDSNLNSLKSFDFFEIMIFFLSEETRLYDEPRSFSKFKVMHEAHFPPEVRFFPIAFTKDYIQIALRQYPTDPDTIGRIDSEPLGWIRMRDDQGRIAFFLY
jgi:hypothetical protein